MLNRLNMFTKPFALLGFTALSLPQSPLLAGSSEEADTPPGVVRKSSQKTELSHTEIRGDQLQALLVQANPGQKQDPVTLSAKHIATIKEPAQHPLYRCVRSGYVDAVLAQYEKRSGKLTKAKDGKVLSKAAQAVKSNDGPDSRVVLKFLRGQAYGSETAVVHTTDRKKATGELDIYGVFIERAPGDLIPLQHIDQAGRLADLTIHLSVTKLQRKKKLFEDQGEAIAAAKGGEAYLVSTKYETLKAGDLAKILTSTQAVSLGTSKLKVVPLDGEHRSKSVVGEVLMSEKRYDNISLQGLPSHMRAPYTDAFITEVLKTRESGSQGLGQSYETLKQSLAKTQRTDEISKRVSAVLHEKKLVNYSGTTSAIQKEAGNAARGAILTYKVMVKIPGVKDPIPLQYPVDGRLLEVKFTFSQTLTAGEGE